MQQEKLKIAVLVDFDNIEIGVKSTLRRDFDVAVVLDALKERGDIVAKFAYADWGRQESAKRQMAENAVQMVQRVPSPRGDKNGADINLALDALEMCFTHEHINAYAIVSGDSDFISLVNKLKLYGKTIFVVGGKAFTSTILQKNCHEFISFEALLDDAKGARQQNQHGQEKPPGHQQPQPQQQQQQPQQPKPPQRRPAPLDLGLAMPLVERALQVLERREVTPQLGLLKSTMLQLDPTFTEKAYGAGSFTEFVEKLRDAGYINVLGGDRRYIIERKKAVQPEKPARKPEEALPILRDVLETHRLEMEDGRSPDDVAAWVREVQPEFDWKEYGFQEFTELLNFAQDKLLVRVDPHEEKGLTVYLGAEFYPPALPESEQVVDPKDRQTITESITQAAKPRRARRKAAAGAAPAAKRSARTRTAGAAPRRTSRKRASEASEAQPLFVD